MTPIRLWRLAGLLVVAILAGCATTQTAPPPTVAVNPPVHRAQPRPRLRLPLLSCRVGPDGGPPAAGPFGQSADRGIGGTGAPAGTPTSGAAGVAAAGLAKADRGIGGTGIGKGSGSIGVVGVVTGFASICVDGLEVVYDPSVPVDIDGSSSDASKLRVGDLVAVRASGSQVKPAAQSISVRTEAEGRIDDVEITTGQLWVGGQAVVVTAGVPGVERFAMGDWVAVSGLRRPDGVIMASRLDPAPEGVLSVRGVVHGVNGMPFLGTLALPAGSARPGDRVHVTGRYAGDVPKAESVAEDRFCATPRSCFVGAMDHLVVQGFVRLDHGRLLLDGMPIANQASIATLGPGRSGTERAAVVSLDRRRDGSFVAVDIRRPEPLTPPTVQAPAQPDPAASLPQQPDPAVSPPDQPQASISEAPELGAPVSMHAPHPAMPAARVPAGAMEPRAGDGRLASSGRPGSIPGSDPS